MYQLKKYEEITFNIIQLLEVQLDGCSLVACCCKEWWSNSKDGCILIWMHAFKSNFTEGFWSLCDFAVIQFNEMCVVAEEGQSVSGL